MASRKDSKGRKLDTGYSQRKDGRYCYRYQVNGKTKSIYDWSLPDLKDKVKQLNRDIEDGINRDKAGITLDQCVYQYIEAKRKIRETTRNNYIYLYEKYIKDELGSRKISTLDFLDFKQLYSKLLDDKLQYGTLKIVHNVLRSALDDMVDSKAIRSNPVANVLKKIRDSYDTQQEKRVAMSDAEQTEFMNYARNSVIYGEYVPLFTILLGTGMRAGECFGLTWDDVDFKQGVININKTLIYKVRGEGNAEFQMNPAKSNAGKRTIPMFPEVRKAFLELREKRIKNGICDTVVGEYSDFVFVNSRNHVHKPNTINRVIDNIIKKYNEQEAELAKKEKREAFQIRHFSAHSFRHTFATNYCKYETNPKIVQEIMGHTDISITMKYYVDVTIESKMESFKKIEGKFKIG